jgi:hypothetical protein
MQHLQFAGFLASSGAGGRSLRLPEVHSGDTGRFVLQSRMAHTVECGCLNLLFINDGLGDADLWPGLLPCTRRRSVGIC